VVAEACDATSAADVRFDASLSSDPSGRPLVSLTWGQDAAGAAADPALAAVINRANERAAASPNPHSNAGGGAGGAGSGARPQLTLPQSSIEQLANGAYTLTVTAVTFLGTSATGRITFTKVGAVPCGARCQAPDALTAARCRVL
jgi:hypothetical protein